MEKRTFTTEQKLKIINEASEQGLKPILERYNIFPASYYSWKKKLETMGTEGFAHGMAPDQLKRIRELEKENKIHIEVRNDNDSRFSAKTIQEFFVENHLNQVFTHPYTPQENGHIKSFHAILAKKLRPYNFWTLQELEQILVLFYEKYKNERLHSSVCNLPPNVF